MWPFPFKQSVLGSGFLKGWTDWHCHILPGVDDGVQSMDHSLRILANYADLGISRVWFTPHIMEDVPNTPESLRARFEELKSAYKGPLELNLAAENMMDNLFEERLEKGELLTLPDNYLLVETSYFSPPMDLWGLLKRIQEKGYRPLLAHPERYVYMGDKEYRRLMDMQVSLQLNLPSLCGLYGTEVRRKAYTLLKAGAYQRAGTDLHRLNPILHCFDQKLFGKDILKVLKPVCGYRDE